MSNIKDGNDFEHVIMLRLTDKGYWSHNFANKSNGQPMDIIAIKDDKKFLLDCKVCSGDYFKLSRIEDNQEHASLAFEKKAKGKTFFVIKMRGEIFVINNDDIIYQKNVMNKKSFNFSELKMVGRDFWSVF